MHYDPVHPCYTLGGSIAKKKFTFVKYTEKWGSAFGRVLEKNFTFSKYSEMTGSLTLNK